MVSIVDRRSNGKNKSAVNRGRFLDRHRAVIKEAIHRSINDRSITDASAESIGIPKKDLDEPFFGKGTGGVREYVRPGNDSYASGDSINRKRPPQGGSGGSDSVDPLDDEFMFTLTKEEFAKYFFEDLALPNLIEKRLADISAAKNKRAGFSTAGAASNMHVQRSVKGAISRRIAMGGGTERRLKEANQELLNETDEAVISALFAEMAELRAKLAKIPFLDTLDLRYRNSVKVPKPDKSAVMFCIMDASASMGESEKEIAKRFFILLYLFLTKAYDKVEVVFIRHTTEAKEVTEHEFFYGRESGGTVASSSLELLDTIVKERYPPDSYNIYVAQASDGDNATSDDNNCTKILTEKLLSDIQYFVYIEIGRYVTQHLWDEYKKVSLTHPHLVSRQIKDISDIYPVFRDLFKKLEE